MSVFKLGDLELEPGDIGKGVLGSVELADGMQAKVPVMVARGSAPGPTFVVTASVHSTEVSGVAALQGLFREVNPAEMRGTLIGVMVSNPLTFTYGDYRTPFDGLNLSGPWYFPSQPDGTQTLRLAAGINEALEKADMVVDMHANPLPSMPFVLVDVAENYKDQKTQANAYKMAQAFGVTAIEMPWGNPASIRACCATNGIPALTAELAGNMHIVEEAYKVGTIGMLNIMKAFDMVDGSPVPLPVTKMAGEFRWAGRLRANRGGLMYIRKSPGEKIGQGDTVIEIVNVYGDVVEHVKMPIDGYCWSFTGGIGNTHAISEGDNLAYIFEELSDNE
jgi:predicted deacylase